jgi:hypothetical protein
LSKHTCNSIQPGGASEWPLCACYPLCPFIERHPFSKRHLIRPHEAECYVYCWGQIAAPSANINAYICSGHILVDSPAGPTRSRCQKHMYMQCQCLRLLAPGHDLQSARNGLCSCVLCCSGVCFSGVCCSPTCRA